MSITPAPPRRKIITVFANDSEGKSCVLRVETDASWIPLEPREEVMASFFRPSSLRSLSITTIAELNLPYVFRFDVDKETDK